MSSQSGEVPFQGRLRRWVPDAAPPEGIHAARVRLAGAIRAMNALLIDADLPEEDLIAAAETAEAFVARLADSPQSAVHWGFAETANAGDTRAFFDRSPIIGQANAIAPPLRLRVEGETVVGDGSFGSAYEGPPGHVHGGWVAAAFDEVLGMVQSVSGTSGMTGTLVVKYRRPTPLHTPLRFLARVDRVEGRKIFTSATLHAGDTLCAESEAIFVAVGEGRFRAMASEMEADPGSR